MKKLAISTVPVFVFSLGACTRPASPQWPTEPTPAAEIDKELGSADGSELDERPVRQAEREAEGEQGAEIEAQGPEATLFIIDIDPEIVAKCDKVQSNRVFFELDEARVQQQYKDRLANVASCMTEGPLQNEDLVLIGMADRRGPSDYDYDLGGRRADSVARFLGKNGLDQKRLQTVSVGERYASAYDAESPAFERRVSLRLAENVQDVFTQGQG